jgi:hypothetical protein
VSQHEVTSEALLYNDVYYRQFPHSKRRVPATEMQSNPTKACVMDGSSDRLKTIFSKHSHSLEPPSAKRRASSYDGTFMRTLSLLDVSRPVLHRQTRPPTKPPPSKPLDYSSPQRPSNILVRPIVSQALVPVTETWPLAAAPSSSSPGLCVNDMGMPSPEFRLWTKTSCQLFRTIVARRT